MKIRKLAAVIASVAVASALAVSASAFTAGIDIKLSNWAHRNSLNQSKAMYNNEDEEMGEVPGWKVNDVTFDKDGQYTCSVEFGAMEDGKDGDGTFWRVVKLETDIEANDGITLTVDKLVVDGKEVAGASDAVQMTSKPEKSDDYDDKDVLDLTTEYIVVELFNEWNSDSKYIKSSDFGRKVEITFTVSGLGGGDEQPGTNPDTEAAGGDTNQTTPDKNNADTGVEGVAVVAGLAVIAAGAVVVAKKRK